MLIDQILLQIFHKLNNERTINAAFHLLRGKRSGQTIQDVGLFKLYSYFGLLRKYPKIQFNEVIARLIAVEWITVDKDGYFIVTQAGKDQVARQSLPYFDGWHYRGNEHVFFARLSLIVQTLSYQSAGHKRFLPIQRNEQIQAWCRRFLIETAYTKRALQQPLFDEIVQTLNIADVSQQQREMILARLSGVQVTGVTWQQIAMKWQLEELDAQLLFISSLHSWLQMIEQQRPPILQQLAMQIRVENVLTDSTHQTANFYKQGYTLAQISHMRQLKMSTIEDHIVELAMNDANFDLRPFLQEADEQAVQEAVQNYATKKLKILREVLPHLSYFQIRLALAKEG